MHKRDYPQDVENSIRRYMVNVGIKNPDAYISRFDLTDIFETVNAILEMTKSNSNIRNPSGLLWRMLEAKERKETQRIDALKKEKVEV